jgi:hypothetical protein
VNVLGYLNKKENEEKKTEVKEREEREREREKIRRKRLNQPTNLSFLPFFHHIFFFL